MLFEKITPDGLVSTFAGTPEITGSADGPGLEASFNGVTSITYEALNKVFYVGDAYNNLVRKIIDLNQAIPLYLTGDIAPVCEGEEIELQVSPAIYDTYYFYLDGILVENLENTTYQNDNLLPGVHQLKAGVILNGNTFFSNELTIEILEVPDPAISVLGNTTLYEGDSTILITSQGIEYFWSTEEETPTITVYESGIYYVEVTNASGCSGISTPVEIIVNDLPEVPIIFWDGNNQLCPGEMATLYSDYDQQNQWLVNGLPIPGATQSSLAISKSGIYQVQVVTPDGLTLISHPVEITGIDPFGFDFSSNQQEIIVGESVQFEVSALEVLSCYWDFGDMLSGNSNTSISNAPQHNYNNTGSYDVQLICTDSNGCLDTLLKTNYINVTQEEEEINSELFIPTAFTPNSDGENDMFFIRGNTIEQLQLSIFNQWGQQLFFSSSKENGWDGNRNGSPVQNGTYTYLTTITFDDGTIQVLSGHITVLR